MSFIYPRTIKITRPAADTGVGAQPYQGLVATNETLIVDCVPASIQIDRSGLRPSADLPGDVVGRGAWKIFFRQPRGTVLERDIITDDLGNRYQVTNAYWNSLGYNLRAERLQT